MIPELPPPDNITASKPTPLTTPSAPVAAVSPVRAKWLREYEAEVLDFVCNRLKLGVAEDRVVEQLLRHSFTEDEARRLVTDLAADETLQVTHVADLYEKAVLDLVTDYLGRGISEQDVVRMLAQHDFSKQEARELVDALVADPDLVRSTKEAIAADVDRGARDLAIGIFAFFGGIILVAVLMFGRVYSFRGLIFGVVLILGGAVEAFAGMVRLASAKAKPPR